MKKVLCLLLLVGFVGILTAQTKKYPPIEELNYTGYYNWGFIWMRAGAVKFRMEASEHYPNAVKLEAVGSSLPSWDWVFRLRDTLVSHFDAQTFMPYEFSRKAHEGNYHKTFDYVWDYDSARIFSDVHRIGKYQRKDTIALQPDTYDMLSVAWKARGLDFDNYQPQEQIPIKVLMDDKIYDLYIRYLGTDKVKVKGKKREAYVFAPLVVEGEVFKGGEDMKIWVSKDEYRIPLMVEAKILVGSVKGILDSFEVRKEDKTEKKDTL